MPEAVSERVPVSVPAAVGTKSTEMEQVLLAGMDVPEQVLAGVAATAKFAEMVGDDGVTADELPLVTVKVWVTEVELTGVGAKVAEVGL